MKKILINKLLNDDTGDIKTFFDDIEDYSYRDLPLTTLIGLLKIKNIKSRYEALESITCNSELKKKQNYILFVLSAFQRVEHSLIADVLKFTCINNQLLNSSPLKFENLINIIIESKDYVRANALSNIFCSKKVLELSDEDYLYLLSYVSHALSTQRLEKLEEKVYSNAELDVLKECKLKKLSK